MAVVPVSEWTVDCAVRLSSFPSYIQAIVLELEGQLSHGEERGELDSCKVNKDKLGGLSLH